MADHYALGLPVEPDVYWRTARESAPMEGSCQPFARSSGMVSVGIHSRAISPGCLIYLASVLFQGGSSGECDDRS